MCQPHGRGPWRLALVSSAGHAALAWAAERGGHGDRPLHPVRVDDSRRGVVTVRSVRTGVVLAVAGTLFLAACGGVDEPEPVPIGADGAEPTEPADDDGTDEPEPDPEPEPDVEPAGPTIDEIPDDPAAIDEDYVQAVLEALDPLIGEAFATLADAGDVDEDALIAFGQAYTTDTAAERAQEFAGSEYLVAGTGGPETTLRELQTVTVTCVNAVVDRDVTGMLDPPGEVRRWSVSLVPAPADHETGVAWVMAEDYLDPDESAAPRDGCAEGVGPA